MDGIRILLISKEPELVSSWQEDIFPHTGYEPIPVAGVQEAMWQIQQTRPDMIFLHLAEYSDLQVLAALRQGGVTLPAILLLPDSCDMLPKQAVQLGVHGYLPLPVETSETILLVERVVTESRAQRKQQALSQEMSITHQYLEKRAQAVTALYGLGRSLAEVLEPARLLDYVVESAVHLIMADEGVAFLPNGERGDITVWAERVPGHRTAGGGRLRIEQSLAQMVMQTGQPLLIADMSDSYAEAAGSGPLIRSLLNVPLRVREHSIGVLSVVNKATDRPFVEDDILVLTVLADYAAVALENARLCADSQRMAAMDVFRQTIAALSHYINNPLATLMAGIHTLAKYVVPQGAAEAEAPLAQALQTVEEKAEEIATVITVLQEVVVPTSTQYWREEKMIDIEKDLQQRLESLNKSSRKNVR